MLNFVAGFATGCGTTLLVLLTMAGVAVLMYPPRSIYDDDY